MGRLWEQTKYQVSAKASFWGFFYIHFEDKNFGINAQSPKMNSMREEDFDVTIIPKLICLQSQVLRASSVQSAERQRHTSEKMFSE